MNLAVSNIAWTKEDDKSILTFLEKKEIRFIEIAPSIPFKSIEKTTLKEAKQYKNYLSDFGLQCVSFQSLFYQYPELNIFTHPEKALMVLEKLMEISSTLGAKNFVFGSPRNRKILDFNKSEINDKSLNFFQKAGDLGKQYQCKISLEANPKIYDCDFLTRTEEVISFLNQLDHDYIKLNLDLGAIKVNNQSLSQIIFEAKTLINHVHLSEPYLEKFTSFDQLSLLKSALKEINYSNYISLEMRAHPDLKEVIKKLKEY